MALWMLVVLLFWALQEGVTPAPSIDEAPLTPTDATSECPAGLNPLILSASSTEVNYGENVSVSCVSTVAEHEGMSILDANGNTIERTKGNFSLQRIVDVSDWDMTISCRIKLNQHNATSECHKTLPIIVFKHPDKVLLDQSPFRDGETKIRCDIINVAPAKNVKVTWMVNDLILKSGYSTDDQIKTPSNVSDTITLGRKLIGSKLELFVELVLENTHGIIKHNLVVAELGSEQQDSDYSLFCDMAFDCPLEHSYSTKPETSVDSALKLCDNNISDLWDTLSNETKEGKNETILYAAIEGPVKEWSSKHQCYIHLLFYEKCYVLPPIVFYTIPDVKIYMAPDSGPVLASSIYSLNCDIINVVPLQNLTFMWLEDNSFFANGLSSSDDTTLMPQNITDSLYIWSNGTEKGKIYTCHANLNLGPYLVIQRNASISITAEYKPIFSCATEYALTEYTEWKTQCVADGLPPPVITWLKDGKEVAPPQLLTRNITGTYTLRATNNHGSSTHTLYINVLYPPTLKAIAFSFEFKPGDNLMFNCGCDGNPTPSFSWNYVNATNVQTSGWRNSTLEILNATSTNAAVYNCTTTNILGSVSMSVTTIMTAPKSSPIPESSPVPNSSPLPKSSPVPDSSPVPKSSPVPESTLVPESSSVPESNPVPEGSAVPVAVILMCVLVSLIVLALIFICLNRKRHGQYTFKGRTDNIPLETSTVGNVVAT